MLPKYHIILGFIFSLFLFIIFPQIKFSGFLIIFLSSFLIDIDHYFYYIYRKKDFSLKNAYNWFVKYINKYKKLPKNKRNNVYIAVCIFHGIEVIIILGLLINFSKIFLFIITGFLFHYLSDYVGALYNNEETHNLSLIYHLIKIQKSRNIEDI